MTYVAETIDLSRLPFPDAIELLDNEALFQAFVARFLAVWDAKRLVDPSLPMFDVHKEETDPAVIVGQAWSFLRHLDRQRVNDGIMALLAPRATAGNLDNLVAGRNVQRQIIVPAGSDNEAIMEGDAALLRRFLLSFDAPSAGSAGRYLFDAWSAWPQSDDRSSGLWHARVNGRAVHGRRGDTDVVLIGPFGRLPTAVETSAVRAAVTNINRAPEAVAISVMPAERVEYTVHLVLEVHAAGAVAAMIRSEAEARVRAAAIERIAIGGEIPAGLLAGAAYGPGVTKVHDAAPVVITPAPYKVPVLVDPVVELGDPQ
jgi:phage-related baseplate assembly protein